MFAVLLAAAFALPAQWQGWQFARPVDARPIGLAQFVVPPDVRDRSQADLSDLRVIDAAGLEQPYVLRHSNGHAAVTWSQATTDDYGFVPGRYTQIIARRSDLRGDVQTLELATSAHDFAASADVDASDDHMTWRQIARSKPLFDYSSNGLGRNTRIEIPNSTARYFRIRVRNAHQAFPIDGVTVAIASVPGVVDARNAQDLQQYTPRSMDVRHEGGDTIVNLDSGTAHLPINEIRIDTTTPSFLRDISVQASDDGSAWRDAGTGTVSRRARVSSNAIVRFDEMQGRYWRVRVHDANDPPLSSLRAELWGAPTRLLFEARGRAPYTLIYGSARAVQPQYDLSQRVSDPNLIRAKYVRLSAATTNASYVDQAPWSERHPELLWVALGVAILGVGFVAFRTLRTRPASA